MGTSNWDFVIAAYTVAWVAVIGYWIFVHRAARVARERYDQAMAAAPSSRGTP
jgi:hypothetical protein